MNNKLKHREMEVYTLEHTLFLLKKEGSLNGYYWLYPDGTEGLIEDNPNVEKVKDYYKKDVAVGKEIGFLNCTLMDGKHMRAPKVIDISHLDSLNELEYSMWHTIEEYLDYFGIQRYDDKPDWATVKEVQNRLFDILSDCGIQFCYKNPCRHYPELKNPDIFVGEEFLPENDSEWGICITFYLETYFNVDAYFGENTGNSDDTWINFYAKMHPNGTDLKGYYVICSNRKYEKHEWNFTLAEKEMILKKCEERCKKETRLKTISEFAKEMI